MVVEIAKTQENVVGDGTTTAVVIAGELLKKAEDLLDQEIHPTVLARGYRLAEVQAQQILKQLGEHVSLEDKSILKNIAITAMTGKGAETNKEFLAELLLQAVNHVAVHGKIDLDNIKVETIVGESVEKSELVQG